MEWVISQKYMALGHLFLIFWGSLLITLIVYFIGFLTLQIFLFIIFLVVIIDVGTYFIFSKVSMWNSVHTFYINDDDFGIVVKEKNIYIMGPIKWDTIYHIKILPKITEIYYLKNEKKYLAKFVYRDIFMNKKEKRTRKEIIEEIIKRVKSASSNAKIEVRGWKHEF
ncbi:MAG: hypothetical protein GXO25_06585 [Euryarchaeota archaeon]|nr:hypothetical protein [Euryarchaeota archaeon]